MEWPAHPPLVGDGGVTIGPWVFACMLLLDLNSMFDVWRMRLLMDAKLMC